MLRPAPSLARKDFGLNDGRRLGAIDASNRICTQPYSQNPLQVINFKSSIRTARLPIMRGGLWVPVAECTQQIRHRGLSCASGGQHHQRAVDEIPRAMQED